LIDLAWAASQSLNAYDVTTAADHNRPHTANCTQRQLHAAAPRSNCHTTITPGRHRPHLHVFI
jgi:hypothetical protein